MKTKTSARIAVVAVALCTSAAALAVPPTPAPPQSSGPDVVVGGIGSSGSGSAPFGDSLGTGVSTNGVVGDITAYSVGTISCNIGNQDFIWIRDSFPGNRHPVIGTQVYRYRVVNGAGQFEQVGMNWLKHGFCALDAANCFQLTNPPGTIQIPDGNCDWLRPYGTDTYSAGLNGQQGNLGPRSEINPWTGAYPYPYVLGWGQTGNAVYKRTQVRTSDLVGSASWIFEVVYIPSQNTEPVANRYNNYSYRTATLNTGNNQFTLGAATQALRPAIVGWKEQIDPNVTLVNVDPSGTSDGRLILGYRVTQIGDNSWHYEYALFNMNNDAGVGSLALPVDSALTLSNVEFRAPFYHSGEPYDSTPWAFSQGGGVASWATQTFAQNPNANACRWSTTYSFRFDCDQPPTAGEITLGMFKTGDSVNVAVQVPSVPPPPTPGAFDLSTPKPGETVADLTPTLTWTRASDADEYSVKVADNPALTAPVASGLTSAHDENATSWVVTAGALRYNREYYWGAQATNAFGSTPSTPSSQFFMTPPSPCQGDINGDGHTNTADLTTLLGNFGQDVDRNCCGDLDGDGFVGTPDLTILLGGFGC